MNIHTQTVVVFVLSARLSVLAVKMHSLQNLSGCLILQGILQQVAGVAYHFTSCLTEGEQPKSETFEGADTQIPISEHFGFRILWFRAHRQAENIPCLSRQVGSWVPFPDHS